MRHKHYDCIVAWAEGEEIEIKINGGEWEPVVYTPTWENWREYRIRPKKVKKEGWINICLDFDGRTRWCVGPYDTKKEADKREYEMASVRLACIRIDWEEEQ